MSMFIKHKIRHMVEEQLVQEASKNRFIFANENLTNSQKHTLADIFEKRPNLEGKIDWNKSAKLTWDDFQEVMKDAATIGLSKIKKNKDYVEVKNFECDDERFVGAYIPLNHNAANVLRSASVGFRQVNWCIGHDNDKSMWTAYTYGDGNSQAYHNTDPSIFIIVVYLGDKYAIQVQDGFNWVWDAKNTEVGDDDKETVPGVNVDSAVNKISRLLTDVRETLDADMTDRYPFEVEHTYPDGYMDVQDSVASDYTNGQYPIRSITGQLDIDGCDLNYKLPVYVGENIHVTDCSIPGDRHNDLQWDFETVQGDVELRGFREVKLVFERIGSDLKIVCSAMNIHNVSLEGEIEGDVDITYGDLSYDNGFDSYRNDQIIDAAKYDWEESGREEAYENWISDEDNDPEDFDDKFDESNICWDCYDYVDDTVQEDYFRHCNPDCTINGTVTISSGR